MHKCPGPECATQVDAGKLACGPHWYQVAKPVRDAVWREYKKAPGSQAHRHAMDLAIKVMTPLEASRG